MSIKRKLLLTAAVLVSVFLLVQIIVYLFVDNRISSDISDWKDELDQRGTDRSHEEIAALADALEVFLAKEEDNIDDSMYHAAIALQKLDTLTEVTTADMEALLKELRVNDLYLAGMDGQFTVSTVPGAVGGVGLFEIWDGYRMLVTGSATELPSAIKIMIETGEIYKFTAVPRYDIDGNITGALESALEVSIIEENMKTMINNYNMINSFHLFEGSGLTLLSVEKPASKSSFAKGKTAVLSDITNVFNSAKPLLATPGNGTIVYYKTINRFGSPAYVLRLELDESYYTSDTYYMQGAMESLGKNSLSNLMLVLILGLCCSVLISVGYMALVQMFVVKPVANLQSIIGRVSQNIGGAVKQLMTASASLADASTSQAASVEQTSATMNESVSMIKQTADNTFRAKELSNNAGKRLKEAIVRVEQLIKSMGKLRTSSDEITNIVGIMREISSQTNILALNASVESARAGEVGKSFMVVAEEVRTLAQKSSQSVDDTDSIVKNNQTLTRQSVDDSNTVSKMMNEVWETSAKSGELLDEVSLASEDQARGIQQINAALSDIERTTQSSAAISEQSAAAANELQSQTDNLNQICEDIRILIYGTKSGS